MAKKDIKPFLLRLGFCMIKKGYDLRGNLTRQTYHGVNGEPALYNNEYHGWESQFDDRGNETGTIFLGLDGKPALEVRFQATTPSGPSDSPPFIVSR